MTYGSGDETETRPRTTRTAAGDPLAGLGRLLGVEMIAVSRREKVVAAVGGGLAILGLVAISFWAVPGVAATSVLASMGASAVLLFAIPHGQLSQPWPVIGGHAVSAVIGVASALIVPWPAVAAAVAVGLAIAAMSQLRCIHPPGGATALAAVIGGQAVHGLGFRFVVAPVLANALFMVSTAIAINYAFRWRRYPAALGSSRQSARRVLAPTHAEVVAAVRSLESFVDVDEEDIIRLADMLSLSTAGTSEGEGMPQRHG